MRYRNLGGRTKPCSREAFRQPVSRKESLKPQIRELVGIVCRVSWSLGSTTINSAFCMVRREAPNDEESAFVSFVHKPAVDLSRGSLGSNGSNDRQDH